MQIRTLYLLLTTILSVSAYSQSTIDKTFSGIKEIKISTASGDCKIIKSSDADVSVNLTYSYAEDVYSPILEQDGDVLILKEKFRKNSSGRGNSNWALEVPDNVDISYNSGSGDIELRDLNLIFSSNTGSGDVEIIQVNGELKTNSGSGEVAIDGFNGELKVNTGSGDVTLDNSLGKLMVNLGSGNLDVDGVEGGLKLNAGSGNIRVEDAIISEPSSINSGSGDANVRLKSDLQADISINSGSGDAILDFNGLDIQGEFTMKANKDRGEITAPFDFDDTTEERQGNQTIVTKTAKIGNSNIAIKVATGSGRASIQK